MYFYIKGIVSIIDTNYIVVDNNGVGYLIYVANPYYYKEKNEYTVYVYQQIREDENTLYGFNTLEEKDLFMKLISVKGLGCKMALGMFSSNIDDLYSAIETGNISFLKKFPKIGDKVAKQIILDLKGKLNTTNVKVNNDYDELIEVLKGLGYKSSDINKILPSIKSDMNIEDQIKEALKLMLK